ncbi:MAG TPA: NAD(P)H-dependent oxidoreductase [Baekduia sp.]|nr:NAD(P)H-dependent oxidoreductase [Baekduia sp.]
MSEICEALRAPRTALIVHAHPEPASFSTSQMQVAASALRTAGYDVEILDLYATSWNAILDRHDFPGVDGYFKPQAEQMRAAAEGTLPTDVAEHLRALKRADLLVLSFPLWWFSVPAILKGWIDRVFVMGELFGGTKGLFDQAGLVGRQAILLITTGGSEHAFTVNGGFGQLDDLLLHVHHGMLRFVGYDVLQPVVTYGPVHLDQRARASALGDVRAAFEAIDLRDSIPALGDLPTTHLAAA